ncbi:hypothetical protein PT285_00950 [Lactobacillus sp. ESL0791]|uniref:hypothetical protein n=1 Tax=Lactobacillus sp. ESL0791 TaxID=2983234 RepID=UPI0023F823FB|nr:hypothetical protein [Lactobacillus sp. ESL0791]MDF7638006.1 hypothetical protein [Lactobacillus sp. ESL0791]
MFDLTKLPAERQLPTQWQYHNEQQRYYYLAGKKVAASTCGLNPYHPYALEFAAGITPELNEAKQEEIFAQILTELEQAATKQGVSALLTKDYAPQLVFNNLAQKHGFKLIRKTIEPEMPFALIPQQQVVVPDGCRIATFDEIADDSAMLKKFSRLNYEVYRQNHLANPVMPYSAAKWDAITFTDFLKDAPLLILRNAKILAYNFLFADKKETLSVVWMGGKPEYLDLLQKVQLNWGRTRFSKFAGEFDSTDKLAARFYRLLPFDLCPVYETFKKELTD